MQVEKNNVVSNDIDISLIKKDVVFRLIYVTSFLLLFVLEVLWWTLFFLSLSSLTFVHLTHSELSQVAIQGFSRLDAIIFIVLALVFIILITLEMWWVKRKKKTSDIFVSMKEINSDLKLLKQSKNHSS